MNNSFLIFGLSLTCLAISCSTKSEKEAEAIGNETTQEIATTDYLAAGKEITGEVFSEMRANLLAALQEEGVKGALKYCNQHASIITSEMEKKFDVHIQRLSHLPRNPENEALAEDLHLAENYMQQLALGVVPESIVKEINGKTLFYAPIITQTPCLNCHGEPGKNMKEDDYAYIKSLYPKDKAIGFSENQLRGIWKITFPDKSK